MLIQSGQRLGPIDPLVLWKLAGCGIELGQKVKR